MHAQFEMIFKLKVECPLYLSIFSMLRYTKHLTKYKVFLGEVQKSQRKQGKPAAAKSEHATTKGFLN